MDGRMRANESLYRTAKACLPMRRPAATSRSSLRHKLLGKAIVIADADRVGAAEWAKRRFGVTAFVLDDAFQHRKVRRDVDIVCIDATDPFGGGKLLPAGRLREPLADLSRADIIVITRVEQVQDISDLRSQISEIAPDSTVIECRTRLAGARLLTSESQRRRDKKTKLELSDPSMPTEPVFAFCGLGNPQNFFALLEKKGVFVAGTRALRDHHNYTQLDVGEIERYARESGAGALITTAKDAVKLVDLRFSLPCYVAEIEIELDDPGAFTAAVMPA